MCDQYRQHPRCVCRHFSYFGSSELTLVLSHVLVDFMMEVERALRMLDGAVSLIVSRHFLLTGTFSF
jgi:hypothetical protein